MSKEVKDFPIYAAESVVSIEKMTGKCVKAIDITNEATTMVVDGQTRTDSKQRLSLRNGRKKCRRKWWVGTMSSIMANFCLSFMFIKVNMTNGASSMPDQRVRFNHLMITSEATSKPITHIFPSPNRRSRQKERNKCDSRIEY